MPADRPDANQPPLQQQPARDNDPQQQRAGGADFQPGDGAPQQQMGEGSYEATRDYQKNIKGYMERADIESDAERAKPRSEQEARELDQAEREARSHSKGER